MTLREFGDAAGRRWRVWSTVPDAGESVREEFRRGWLTFEGADAGRLRLAPIPEAWQHASAEELEALRRRASPAPPVERRAPGQPAVGRRGASVREGPAGELLFRDDSGREWRVLDRRGADRRQLRTFLGQGANEATRECLLEPGEIIDATATALGRQLLRAAAVVGGGEPAVGGDG